MQKLESMQFHHIGFAVRSFEEACPIFEALGAVFFHCSEDTERNLTFRFAKVGEIVLELVSPCDATVPCAVTNYIKKQSCTPYHICYETDDLESELKRLKGVGFKQMGKTITSKLYGYEAIGVFLYSKEIGLIEVVMECGVDE